MNKDFSKILIIGAGSAIAVETAKCFAKDGAELFLADLKMNRLEIIKKNINAEYPSSNIYIYEFDAMAFEKHENILNAANDALGGIDVILIAYGTLPDQAKVTSDNNEAVKEFTLNATSIISLSTIFAKYFEIRQSGTLAVISSVAGDRGRQSNYLYGSAKGAVSIFLQGLRNHLFDKGINVLTIKPGMVDTPMTSHLDKSLLFAKAKVVGEGIFKAIKNRKDIVYLPGFWKIIMLVIKLIPESIFKKLKL